MVMRVVIIVDGLGGTERNSEQAEASDIWTAGEYSQCLN